MSKTTNSLHSILNHPGKLIRTTLVVILAGFIVQGFLPYQVNMTHGSFANLSYEDPLVLKGQEVYQNQGCQYCHTKNLRPFQWELGRFSNPAKFGYFPESNRSDNEFESPVMLGSTRIGPDLSRISTKVGDEFDLEFLMEKEGTGVLGKFHNYGKLFENSDCMNPRELSWKIRMLMNAGVPYSDPFHRNALDRLNEKTEGDALLAYLMTLGNKKAKFAGKFYGQN
jgi:cytochrome c oxidase cbb3-type subunit 2